MAIEKHKRIELLGNTKYRFKQDYKGILIYEQFSTNGYAVHNSFAIKCARAPWIKIDSYNHITEEMLLDMLDEAAEKGSLTFKGSKDKDGNYFFHDSYDEVTLFVLDEKMTAAEPVNELKKLEDRLQSVMDDCMEFSQNNEKFLENMDEFEDFNTTVIAGLDEAIDSVRFCISEAENQASDYDFENIFNRETFERFMYNHDQALSDLFNYVECWEFDDISDEDCMEFLENHDWLREDFIRFGKNQSNSIAEAKAEAKDISNSQKSKNLNNVNLER